MSSNIKDNDDNNKNNTYTPFLCEWYDWCVHQSFFWLKKNDVDGWIHWWAERNRFRWNLTDEEINCYRKFKTAEYERLKHDMLACANGKPHTKSRIKLKV